MSGKFDTFILGQISLDINTDYDGKEERVYGGAVLAAAYAASGLGHRCAAAPKADTTQVDLPALFTQAPNVTVFPLHSPTGTSIQNIYHTADRERRTCRALSRIQPYRVGELPSIDAAIYHIAGLMRGDFGDEMIAYAAQKSMAAVDVQCLLRVDEGGEMVFRDWETKRDMLPMIRFLKTDAAEAEILTHTENRYAAAKILHDWGAKEVMITHNTEVIVYDGKQYYSEPLLARNLSGRTGRGDTTFSGYLCERLHAGIPQALRMAAALVSLKMETPGPFKGTREDVLAYLQQFYS